MINVISARRLPPMVISMVAFTTAFVTVLAPTAVTAAPGASSTTTKTASSAAVAGATVGDRASHSVSRAGATKRALQVLKVKKGSDPVRVFALKQIRKPGDRITQAGRSQSKRSVHSTVRAPLVFQLRKRSYIFYADDAPHTLYQHRGRIVIVPLDGSKPTVRRTTFVPLVNGVAPSFLRSQSSYLSYPTVFARDYSAGAARSENRPPARAVNAAAELAVARTLAEQRTCVVRAATTGFTYGRPSTSSSVSGRSASALGKFYTRLAARAPGLVSVTWSPRKSSASSFISTLIAKRGCRSVLVIAAGGGYVTGAPAVTLGTAVFSGRRAKVEAQNLTATDLSTVVARHPGVAISFVLDAPYTGRFSKRLSAPANVEALVTPGGTTRPSFSYLPGIRSGGRYLKNSANPRRLQETSNQIVTGLSQFMASADELRNYQKLRSQGKARSLVSWMLVRSSRLGAVDAMVPKVKGAPTPFVYSPVAVTAPVPRGVPSAEARTLTVDEDDSATVTFAGTDPEGKPVTFEVVDAPAHGVLAAVAGGVRYTPAANFHGPDSFTYRAIAEDGVKSAPATVSVTVTPVNDGPTGGTFDTTVDEDSANTTVAAPGLLAGASDLDGDALAATPATGAGTEGGDFEVRADGSFDYDPDGAFEDLAEGEERVDTFAVTVEDPAGLSTTVTIRVRVIGGNDAPKVELDTTSAAYTEDGPNVDLAPSLTLTDVDDANISSASVKIADGESSDVLTWTVPSGSGITSSYDAPTRKFTASGTASKADYRELLRSVAFHTVSDTPDESPRTVTFTVIDPADGDGSDALTLAVTAHDDPSSAVADTATVVEDSGSTVIDVLANDVDPDGNGPEVASVGQPEDGTVTLVDGDVSYTPPANFNGSTSFTYTLVGGSTATVSVTVTAVNDAPTLGGGTGSASTEGGAAAVIVHGDITVADVDNTTLAGATVSIGTGFDATDDRLVFTDTAAITGTYNASSGVLTLTGADTTAAYQTALRSVRYQNVGSGGATVTTRVIGFRVTDGSATDATSNTVTSNVTIAAVNAAPSLSGGGALDYTENDAATAISPALVLTDDNTTFTGATVSITDNFAGSQDRLSFTNAAPISGSYNPSTGVLTLSGTATVAEYQAALRAVKYDNTSNAPSTPTRTVTYRVSDGELSGSETATVTVTAVNDAPVADDESFSSADSAIGNTSLVGDDATDGAPNPAGPQKVISANILAGDTDAEGDSLAIVPGTFASNDGGSVTVQADGDFIFTPAAGTSCSDHSDFFDYTVTDGASPTPGNDTGRVTIAITDCVWYVDNTASAGGDGTSGTPYDTLAEADAAATTTGAYIYVYEGDGTTAGLTGGVALLADQRLVGAAEDLTVAGTTLENGSNAERPAISGSVTLAAGNTVEGLAITASGANAINGGTGDASGTLDDLVLTPSGAAGSGITLNGTSGTWNVSDTAITATTGAQGIFVSSAGTVNFASAGTIVVTAAGPAFSALSTAVSGVIDTTTSTGGSYGWALNAVTGSIDLGTGTVSGHTSTEVSVTAGTGNVTYAGTIGNGSGTSVVVQNRTTGAITLSGDIADSNDAGGGISMSGNSGGSTTFSGSTKTIGVSSGSAVNGAFTGNHTLSLTGGGLDIDASGSAAGIALSGSNGTVVVSGSGNTIDAATGTPLSINGPDIGATGVTVQRISSNGAANGIVLANTGSAGGLTVTGTGTSGSGGVITTSTGPGISLSNTQDISLSGVNVTNGGDDGIRGTGVNGFAIAGGAGLASSITGNGNAAGESGMDFTDLSGVATINNATVTGNYDNNLAIANDAATLTNFTIDDGSYGSTNSSGGNDSIQIVNTGTGNLTGTIKNVDFMNSRGDHIQLVTDNDPTTTATQKLTVEGNTLSSTALSSTVLGGGIALGVGGGATQTVLVDNNDIDHAHGAPMSFNTTTGTSPNANWTVNNNRIGNTGEVKSGSVANSGFYINVNGNGNAKFNLTNNTIMQTDFTAVDAVQNDGDAAMNITMKGNVITEPGTTIDYAYGLRFVIGSDDGDAGTSCLDLGHPSTTALKNRFFGSGNSSQGYQDVRLRMAGDATVNLAGFTGGAHDNAAVNSWLQTRNNIGGTPTTSSSQFDADSFYGQVSSCPLPSVP